MSCPSGKSKKVCETHGSGGVPQAPAKNPRHAAFMKAVAGLIGLSPKALESIYTTNVLEYRANLPDTDTFREMLFKTSELVAFMKQIGVLPPVLIGVEWDASTPLPAREDIAGYAAVFDQMENDGFDFVLGMTKADDVKNNPRFGPGKMRCNECGLITTADHPCTDISVTDGVWWENSDTEAGISRNTDAPVTNKKSHKLSKDEFWSFCSVVRSRSTGRLWLRAPNGFEYEIIEQKDGELTATISDISNRIHRSLIESQLAFNPASVPLVHLGRDYPDLAERYELLAHLDRVRFKESDWSPNKPRKAAPAKAVNNPMSREVAIKCAEEGWPVIVDLDMSGKYTGRLVKVQFEPGKPWRGTVEIDGVLDAARFELYRDRQRRGFRPGQEVQTLGKNIRPTDQESGGTYLESMRARIREIEDALEMGGLSQDGIYHLKAELRHLKEVVANEEVNPPPEDFSDEGRERWKQSLKAHVRNREIMDRQHIDVIYPTRPSDEVCARLRAHGFRFDPDAMAWTAPYSQEREELAQYLAGQRSEPPPEPDVFKEGWRTFKAEDGGQIIAVRFPSVPPPEIRRSLQSAGFRWRDSAWRAPLTPEREALAKSLFEMDES